MKNSIVAFIAFTLTALILIFGCGCPDVSTSSTESTASTVTFNPGGLHNAVMRTVLSRGRQDDPMHSTTVELCIRTGWNPRIVSRWTRLYTHISRDEGLTSLQSLQARGELTDHECTKFQDLISCDTREQVTEKLASLHDEKTHGETFSRLLSLADSSYAMADELSLSYARGLDDHFNWPSYFMDDLIGGGMGALGGGLIGGVAGAAGCSIANAYHQFYGY